MSLFGWRSTGSSDEVEDQSSVGLEPAALPPMDSSVRELEELLAQAKVGTHEFAHIVPHSNIPGLDSDPSDGVTGSKNTGMPSRASDVNMNLTPSSGGVTGALEPQDAPTGAVHDVGEHEDPSTSMGTPMDTPSQQIVAVNTESSPGRLSSPNFNFNSAAAAEGSTLAVFRTPKFRFFTEDKSVPVQLHTFQQHSSRKRHEFQTRLHDVECKVAELTAKVAEEDMDLDLDLRNAMESKVYKPIQAAVESISLYRYASGPTLESATSLSQRWLLLERRLSLLDSKMTHSVHVELQDLKRTHLTSWRNKLDQNILPEAKEESASADKRETALARRWENQAGTMARRFAEEHATRAAALMSANTKLVTELDPCRGQELMVQITALREKLEREREERRAQDERIRRYIVETFECLKHAILEANPDPDV